MRQGNDGGSAVARRMSHSRMQFSCGRCGLSCPTDAAGSGIVRGWRSPPSLSSTESRRLWRCRKRQRVRSASGLARRCSREHAHRGPGGHRRAGPHAMPGAARGDGAGRRFTNQSEIDGAVLRHPPEVVLLARGMGGLDRQARPAARVACWPRRTRGVAVHWPTLTMLRARWWAAQTSSGNSPRRSRQRIGSTSSASPKCPSQLRHCNNVPGALIGSSQSDRNHGSERGQWSSTCPGSLAHNARRRSWRRIPMGR